METEQPPTTVSTAEDSGGGSNSVGAKSTSPLDDLFGDDPATISAIVGQLESSIENSLMNEMETSSSNLNDNDNTHQVSNDKDDNHTGLPMVTHNNNDCQNPSNDINSIDGDPFHKNTNGALFQEQQKTNTTTIPNTITNFSNHTSIMKQSNNLGRSSNLETTTTTASAAPINNNDNNNNNNNFGKNNPTSSDVGGKKILLSANSQPVNSSISNINQQQSSMMKLSPLTNGTMTPPQSPSLQATTPTSMTTALSSSTTTSGGTTPLKQQHIIPVGHQVALVTVSSQQSHVNSASITTTNVVSGTPNANIRPTPISLATLSTPAALSTQTSAISTSFVMTPNQNITNNSKLMTTSIAHKSNPALLTIQSNGQPQQQPMLIATSPNNLNFRPTNIPISNASPQVSLANSMSIASAGGQTMVIDARSQQAQQIQHLTAVSNAAGNVQFLSVNSSRPTLTVPTATVSGAGYSISNMITGSSASIQPQSKQALAPRLVQIPQSVRLSRPGAPGFTAAPLNIHGLVRGQTILIKGENGQMHMVNVPPQTLNAGQTPTFRLQVPAGAQTLPGTTVGASPGAHLPGNALNPNMRTTHLTGNIGGSPIVMPVTLAPGVVNTSNTNNNNIVATVTAIQSSQHQPAPVMATASGMAVGTAISVQPPGTIGSSSLTTAAATTSSAQPLSVRTTVANTQATSAAPSQMSPTTAKKKCKNFLSTLIRLASDQHQPENVANNVKTLIQGLIDDTIQPEDFTNQLQRELNSSPQPCLVPFLKKSLPYLRYSLMREEMTIDGVRPPPANTVAIPSNLMAQTLSQIQNIGTVPTQQPRPSLPPGVRLLAPGGPQLAPNQLIATGGMPGGAQILTSLQPQSATNASMTPIVLSSVNSQQLNHSSLISSMTGITPQINNSTVSISPHGRLSNLHQTGPSTPSPIRPPLNHHQSLPPHLQPPVSLATMNTPQCLRHPVSSKSGSTKSKSSKSKAKSEKAKKEKELAAATAAAASASALSLSSTSASTTVTTPISSLSSTTTTSAKSTTAQHHHAPGERGSSSFRDDDDINDVAAMGGVNLVEESQRILAGNAEIIGQQIRSCKDEPFLYASPLQQRINKIAKRFDLEDCYHDVVALVSHATEERLKTLIERLGVIAEHRQEQLRNNPKYEIVQDVKGQAQFLQELDRIEKRRHEEQEREVLIRAAKSRSKIDDPDHIAIKARAKEMQRLEMEEIRQREANETALQAIGNPKKRLKTLNNSGASGGVSSGGLGAIGNGSGSGVGGFSSLNNSTFGSGLSSAGLMNNNSNNNSGGTNTANSFFNTFVSKPIKRIKRVTMKDVVFMMERDHTTVRSNVLYRTYAR